MADIAQIVAMLKDGDNLDRRATLVLVTVSKLPKQALAEAPKIAAMLQGGDNYVCRAMLDTISKLLGQALAELAAC